MLLGLWRPGSSCWIRGLLKACLDMCGGLGVVNSAGEKSNEKGRSKGLPGRRSLWGSTGGGTGHEDREVVRGAEGFQWRVADP